MPFKLAWWSWRSFSFWPYSFNYLCVWSIFYSVNELCEFTLKSSFSIFNCCWPSLRLVWRAFLNSNVSREADPSFLFSNICFFLSTFLISLCTLILFYFYNPIFNSISTLSFNICLTSISWCPCFSSIILSKSPSYSLLRMLSRWYELYSSLSMLLKEKPLKPDSAIFTRLRLATEFDFILYCFKNFLPLNTYWTIFWFCFLSISISWSKSLWAFFFIL